MAGNTQEIVIRKSKADRFLGYACIILVFLWGSYMLFFNSSWKGLIAILLSLILLPIHTRQFKGLPILLKIAHDGLWTPKHGYKPWGSIFKMRFIRVYKGRTYRQHMEIYKHNSLNPDEVIDLTDRNTFIFKIKRELKKYVLVE